MGFKFWFIRAVKVFISVLILLFLVEQLKGHSLQDSILFALLWAFLSTSVFIGSRIYQSRKGVVCALCNDTPDQKGKNTYKLLKRTNNSRLRFAHYSQRSFAP